MSGMFCLEVWDSKRRVGGGDEAASYLLPGFIFLPRTTVERPKEMGFS